MFFRDLISSNFLEVPARAFPSPPLFKNVLLFPQIDMAAGHANETRSKITL